MKRTAWKNPNKQAVSTGHKTFDSQFTAFSLGNRIGGGQSSSVIRPFNRTECNGKTFPLGHLQQYDIESVSRRGVPDQVRQAIQIHGLDDSLYLYRFYHADNRGDSVTHGYVLTRDGDHFHELIDSWVTGPTAKSAGVIKAAMDYVSNPPGSADRMHNAVVPEVCRKVVDLLNEHPDPAVADAVRQAVSSLENEDDTRSTYGKFLLVRDMDRDEAIERADRYGQAFDADAMFGPLEALGDGYKEAKGLMVQMDEFIQGCLEEHEFISVNDRLAVYDALPDVLAADMRPGMRMG